RRHPRAQRPRRWTLDITPPVERNESRDKQTPKKNHGGSKKRWEGSRFHEPERERIRGKTTARFPPRKRGKQGAPVPHYREKHSGREGPDDCGDERRHGSSEDCVDSCNGQERRRHVFDENRSSQQTCTGRAVRHQPRRQQ